MRGDGGEVLQRLDRLLAALGVARAQRRGEDLLQQRGLAVGRGAEDAQVAPADAVAGELGDRADDLALGLVVVLRAARRRARSPLMTPYSSSSCDQPAARRRSPRGRPRASTARPPADRERQPPRAAPGRASPRRRRRGVAGGARRRSRARRPAPGGSPAAAGTRRAAGAGSCAGARRRRASRAGSRRACAAASAASGPRGSGSSRSRCPGTPARAPCRPRRSSSTCVRAVGGSAGRRQGVARRGGSAMRPGSAREERELVLADLQLVAVVEPVRLDPLAVDVGAVQRAESSRYQPPARRTSSAWSRETVTSSRKTSESGRRPIVMRSPSAGRTRRRGRRRADDQRGALRRRRRSRSTGLSSPVSPIP